MYFELFVDIEVTRDFCEIESMTIFTVLQLLHCTVFPNQKSVFILLKQALLDEIHFLSNIVDRL